jgi:hypothetical protein
MLKPYLLNTVLMTGLFVVSAQVFADTNDQHTQQGQTAPTAEHTNTTTDLQNTSNHPNHTTGSSYNTNTNHGGNSDDVPEDMD